MSLLRESRPALVVLLSTSSIRRKTDTSMAVFTSSGFTRHLRAGLTRYRDETPVYQRRMLS